MSGKHLLPPSEQSPRRSRSFLKPLGISSSTRTAGVTGAKKATITDVLDDGTVFKREPETIEVDFPVETMHGQVVGKARITEGDSRLVVDFFRSVGPDVVDIRSEVFGLVKHQLIAFGLYVKPGIPKPFGKEKI